MRDWQNFFKPLDFNCQHGDGADHKSDLITPEIAAERGNDLIRAELENSGVAIKLGRTENGTKDMVGKVVDVKLKEQK